MKLYNFYHIYADGQWEEPVAEYLKMLKSSGLAAALEGFYVGIVGKSENRDKVKEFISELTPIVISEAESGWEQVTQQKLYEFSLNHDGFVLYSHSKGSSDPSPINKAWRESMVYFSVCRWQEMVKALETVTAAGCHWLRPEDYKMVYIGKIPFFAGTFWWTHLSHIRTLDQPANQTRHEAEAWLSHKFNEAPFKVKDFNPGWPGFKIFKKINYMTLEQMYLETGSKSDKGAGHTYIQKYYSKEFTPRRNDKVQLVEIGVFKGESLELWSNWFTNGTIWGIENNNSGYSAEVLAAQKVGNAYVLNKDAYSRAALDRFGDKTLDYVIDDGPHTLQSQMDAVRLWLPKVKPGGKLIIEDIQKFSHIEAIIDAKNSSIAGSVIIYDLRHHIGRYDDVIIEITRK